MTLLNFYKFLQTKPVNRMSRFLTAGLLLGTLIPAGQAAVFAVKPGTRRLLQTPSQA